MDDCKVNVWNLFREEFKDGEQVIIVHEDCKLYGGRLTTYENYCMVGSKEVPWSEVVFIAHDGFPCRTLHTTLSNEKLDEVENTDSVILMRKLLARKPKEKIITKMVVSPAKAIYRSISSSIEDSWPLARSCGFGCPYELQEVYMQIVNPFGLTENFEETLICQSKDGAVGMLWDLDSEIIEFYCGAAA